MAITRADVRRHWNSCLTVGVMLICVATSLPAGEFIELKCDIEFTNEFSSCPYTRRMHLSDDGDVLHVNQNGYLWVRGLGERETDQFSIISDDGDYLFTLTDVGLERQSIDGQARTSINFNAPLEITFGYPLSSPDGDHVVSSFEMTEFTPLITRYRAAYYWTAEHGSRLLDPQTADLGILGFEPTTDVTLGNLIVSRDGSRIAGYLGGTWPDPDRSALFYWTEASGIKLVDLLNEATPATAVHQMTDDGRMVFGRASPSSDDLPSDLGFGQLYWWTEQNGMVGLGMDGRWEAVTPDGSAAVGNVYEKGHFDGAPNTNRGAWELSRHRQSPALLWTQEEGLLEIGNGIIRDLADDGSVAVGETEDQNGRAVVHRLGSALWSAFAAGTSNQRIRSNESTLGMGAYRCPRDFC